MTSQPPPGPELQQTEALVRRAFQDVALNVMLLIGGGLTSPHLK